MKDIYQISIDYYDKGLWSAERIKALVKAGRLTQEQADEILIDDGKE